MREIKFRGMLRSGKWVYGGYVKIKGGASCILSGECDSYDIDGGVKNILKFNAVKYKTVGEYTDKKDKNGKEIYEGDIVNAIDYQLSSCTEKHLPEPYKICWDDTVCLGWVGEEAIGCGVSLILLREIEVIGNIYENPELLKG